MEFTFASEAFNVIGKKSQICIVFVGHFRYNSVLDRDDGTTVYLRFLSADYTQNIYDVEKYCHIAFMKEIEENGYNLYISRHVDTFEEEEKVDIQAKRDELAIIAARKQAVLERVATGMKELGL